MPHVIILGDPHIGKGLSIGRTGIGSVLNSRVADQLNLLDWTLDQAIEHSVDNIIITGDVFEDPRPHPALITAFIAWLKKCEAYGINIHIILGNHDMLRSGSVFTSSLDIISELDLEHISIYKNSNTIIIGSSAFTILPFRDRKSFSTTSNADAISIMRESLTYELASIPVTYRKVLVGHLAIEGSIPVGDEIDDITNELFCPLDMFNGYDYVWMGHVHKPQVLKKKNPYIAHIGSMDISNFGETDHKKHIVIFNCNSFDIGNEYSIKYLPTRPLVKISITVPKDTIDTTAYVLEEIRKETNLLRAIVRVEIFLSTPELKSITKSTVEKLLLELGAFNVTGITESKKVALIKKDNSNKSIDTKMDVMSAIKAFALSQVEESLREGFIELAADIYKTYKLEVKE